MYICLAILIIIVSASSMYLLLVAVLLASSFCSVSSQYYVSDNCSSVTYTVCSPFSVYAEKISQYNNSVFYFIGDSNIHNDINLHFVENITLHGLDRSPAIKCIFLTTKLSITSSSHITISNLSLYHCSMDFMDSNNLTLIHSYFVGPDYLYGLLMTNVFDVKLISSVFNINSMSFDYGSTSTCDKKCSYSLIVTNCNISGSANGPNGFELVLGHGTCYNLSVIFDHVVIVPHDGSSSDFVGLQLSCYSSLYSVYFTNLTLSGNGQSNNYGLHIKLDGSLHTHSDNQRTEPLSSIVIEESQFRGYSYGFAINGVKDSCFKKSHPTIIMKSCLIYDSSTYGLYVNESYLKSNTISVIDTELIGNGGNILVHSNSIFLSNVTITNSLSTGLTLVGSKVKLNNSLILRNNTGVSGGGMAMNDSSVLIVVPHTSMVFIGNHALYKGGGIFDDSKEKIACHFQAFNTSTYEESIPLTFVNNTAAVAGGDLYGIIFDSICYSPFFFTTSSISSASDATLVFFCDPKNDPPEQDIFPGQELEFYVLLYGSTYDVNYYSYTDGTVDIFLNEMFVNNSYITSNCTLVKYTPNQLNYSKHLITLKLNGYNSIYTHFTLHKCPIGFRLDSSQGVCACSQQVLRENVTCDIISLNITHNGLIWIGVNGSSSSFNANQTDANACIINEDCLLYCSPNPVTFKMNDTDPQCVDNRGQVMCGSCRDGYSLLMGSNKCGHCDNDYMIIAWIALFAVMGILLVVVLIALNLTVSVGTLNGLLFYANIVKLYEPVFSRKGALPVLSQVLSWINLDFGIEACFYNGMDSYAKQWLQFVFPLYLWIIIIVIIWLCRRYGKISRLMGSHAVPVLSTLFLLSYTKLVRTIVIVLHKRDITLHCINGSTISVSKWYEDPNVDYAKGKHAGLFAFALFMSFIFVIPYTLFLSFSPLFEKYFSNYKVFKKLWSQFKPIVDAYSGPMKDEYRFWPGLLLVARIPILLSVTLVDSLIDSHSFLLCMLLTVITIVLSLGYCFGGVYKLKKNDVIEVWFFFNLCTMVGLSVAYDSVVLIWYNSCLSVFIFSFILIVLYHFYLQLSHGKCYNALMKKLFKREVEDDEPLLDVTEIKTVDQQKREIVPSSTDVSTDRRESVVELF